MEWTFESAADVYASSLRRELMATLHAKGAPESDFAAAELIYGELISNVIRHAHGRVCVRLDWSAEFPTLTVRDEERRFERPICLPTDPLAESGRGLFIVKALARDFSVTADEGPGSVASAILPIRRRYLDHG